MTSLLSTSLLILPILLRLTDAARIGIGHLYNYANDPPSTNPSQPAKKKIVIASCAVVLMILFLCLCVRFKKRRARRNEASEVIKANDVDKEKVAVVTKEERRIVFVDGVGFELKDLLKSSAEVLGNGSFGGSYKAVLEDGREFVVKRLRDVSPLTNAEFAKVVGDVAALGHPSLFPLVGYSYSMDEKLLFYNWAPNGNLFDRIHARRGESTRIPFRWASRLSVAKAVARAVAFLHRNARDPDSIPHGNLKSSNVLLSADNEALVSDYGLLPLLPPPLAPHRMAAYRSPEYQYSRKVCRKSDVWSYGCLLLELLTAKVPAHSAPEGTQGVELVNWVHRSVREEWTFEVFDAEISTGRGSMRGMFGLLRLALWCCEGSLDKRPEMEEVAARLDGIVPIDEEDETGDSTDDASFVDDSVLK